MPCLHPDTKPQSTIFAHLHVRVKHFFESLWIDLWHPGDKIKKVSAGRAVCYNLAVLKKKNKDKICFYLAHVSVKPFKVL